MKVWHFDNTTQYHTISGGSGTISVSDGEFKGGCAFLDETFDNNSSWILECDAIFLGGSTGIGLTEPNTVRRQNLRMLKINQSGAFGYSNNSNTWVTVQNLGEFPLNTEVHLKFVKENGSITLIKGENSASTSGFSYTNTTPMSFGTDQWGTSNGVKFKNLKLI